MHKPLQLIGRAEFVELPDLHTRQIPARIDTGAKTSTLWASDIREVDGALRYVLFDPTSDLYTGDTVVSTVFSRRPIANSSGNIEERYVVQHTVVLHGRKIRASFSLANRSSQVYPILIGRNILRGKFIVDVKLGKPLVSREKQRELDKLQHIKSTKKVDLS